LEIKDEKGKTVRKLSSIKDKDFKSYPGGPSADPVLPAKEGLNRFVWNLRHSSLAGAPEAYIEGSYAGRRVVPGTYELRLTAADNEEVVETATLKILGHPEIEASATDYAEQSNFLQSVSERVNTIHGAVNEMAKTKTNIENKAKDLKDMEKGDELIEEGKQLMELNFPNGLSANYLFLKGQADRNTPNVTEPMKARLKELDGMWAPLEAEYRALRETVEAYDRSLKEAGLGVIR